MKLYAPELYWALTPEGRQEFCNGCGAKGIGWMVPEKILGLSITEICDIHDFMYAIRQTEEDREASDRVFRNNTLRLIVGKTKNKILLALRVVVALIYYALLMLTGGPAFWAGKNEPGTEKEVT